MKTVIFDVGNVLVGYDWKSYLHTFNYSEEIYERVADAVTGRRAISAAFPPKNG